MFEQFEDKRAEAGTHRRRLISMGAALAIYGLVGVAVLYAATGERPAPPEHPVEVTFATPEARPPPPAPPPPKPAPVRPRRKRPATQREQRRARAALVQPKSVPTRAPEEADPSRALPSTLGLDDLEERGDPNAANDEPSPQEAGPVEDDASNEPPPVRVPRPPPPVPPPALERVATPIYLPEHATPPRPLPGNPSPVFPRERLRDGVTGTVALKVVVTEGGALEDVRVLRGEDPFVSAVMDVLPKWRFTPATFDGQPLRVFKVLEVAFRIRD